MRTTNKSINLSSFKLLYLIFIFCFLFLVGKLFLIQVWGYSEYKQKALDQQLTKEKIEFKRGEIISSDGFVLATNNVTYNLIANPSVIKDVPDFLNKIVSVISFKSNEEKSDFIKNSQPLFKSNLFYLILKKGLTQDEKDSLESLKLSSIYFEKEVKRFYPEGNLASSVLGFVASSETENQKGYYGIEGRNDKLLKGREGRVIYERGADGQVILYGNYDKQDSINGDSLVLTIDRSIQYIIEQNLKKGVEHYGAKSGQIIVMDPTTGDILGMANYPNFDPYDPYKEFLDDDKKIKSEVKNRCISDNIEPGSVIKPLTVAAAIDLGKITGAYEYDDNGPETYSGFEVTNWDKKHLGHMDLTLLLQKSNNIGAAKIGMLVGSDNLKDYFNRLGFGRSTDVDLEGEERGYIKPDFWSDIDIVSASFGQGFTATPLQVLESYTVFSNNGNLIRPKIIKTIKKVDDIEVKYPNIIEKGVLKPETAKFMDELLTRSVKGNESKYYNIKNFNIAGKTGTAQIAKNGKYLETQTNALFVGYLSTSKKFSMVVRLEEPTSSTYAAETAVPLWMDTASELIKYFNLPPDINN
jgi:cell division protein FtsI/penicillin-binding protein 2